jgi:putative addiction module killer protein
MEYQLKLLTTQSGESPFEEWYLSLRDNLIRIRIRSRLDRLVLGNFGDSKFIADGVYELRLQFGSGYRIYYANANSSIIVLLAGGDKGSQKKDIELAISLWRMFQDDAKRFQRDF